MGRRRQLATGIERGVAQRRSQVGPLAGLVVAIVRLAKFALAGVGLVQAGGVAMEFAHVRVSAGGADPGAEHTP